MSDIRYRISDRYPTSDIRHPTSDMIIGIDASRANRPRKSGTEWYAYYLIRALAAVDADNQYILYADQPLQAGLADLRPNIDQAEIRLQINKKGWQTLRSPHNNFSAKILRWPFEHLWTQGRLSWEMLAHRPDILFIPAHVLPVIHPRRSVVTIHDIGFTAQKKLYSQEPILPRAGAKHKLFNLLIKLYSRGQYSDSQLDYLNWSTQYALNKAKKIIAISDFSKQAIIRYYQTDLKKITVIHNGYNQELYRPITEPSYNRQTLERYNIQQPFIFYVGRLEKKKNTDKLIEAYYLAKNNQPDFSHRLVLVGSASYGYDEIKYQINEFGLVGEVIITGWVEEKDMPAIFNAADGFIFPSLYEGFGIPLLQAMACGTPIAASNIAAIPEVAGEAALLFNPNESQDIAEKIVQLVTDQVLRTRLRAAGFERVKNFSWEKSARETLVLFNSL